MGFGGILQWKLRAYGPPRFRVASCWLHAILLEAFGSLGHLPEKKSLLTRNLSLIDI